MEIFALDRSFFTAQAGGLFFAPGSTVPDPSDQSTLSPDDRARLESAYVRMTDTKIRLLEGGVGHGLADNHQPRMHEAAERALEAHTQLLARYEAVQRGELSIPGITPEQVQNRIDIAKSAIASQQKVLASSGDGPSANNNPSALFAEMVIKNSQDVLDRYASMSEADIRARGGTPEQVADIIAGVQANLAKAREQLAAATEQSLAQLDEVQALYDQISGAQGFADPAVRQGFLDRLIALGAVPQGTEDEAAANADVAAANEALLQEQEEDGEAAEPLTGAEAQLAQFLAAEPEEQLIENLVREDEEQSNQGGHVDPDVDQAPNGTEPTETESFAGGELLLSADKSDEDEDRAA